MTTTPVGTVIPLLSQAQRRDRSGRALAAAARTRNPSRREALLQYAVCLNMDVARDVAGRYAGRGIDRDDLHQVAYTALTRATCNFRPDLDHDFLAYAVPTIRGELKKHFRDLGWTIRVPRRIQDAQPRVTRAESDLAQRFGRLPLLWEIAAHCGLDAREIMEAQSANGCFAPTSLDHPVSDLDGRGATTLTDLLGEEDAAQAAVDARVALAPLVRRLEPRDQRILYLRFFEDRTQQEIADDIGVTQMQVSRRLTRILTDLRRQLGALESPEKGDLAARAS